MRSWRALPKSHSASTSDEGTRTAGGCRKVITSHSHGSSFANWRPNGCFSSTTMRDRDPSSRSGTCRRTRRSCWAWWGPSCHAPRGRRSTSGGCGMRRASCPPIDWRSPHSAAFPRRSWETASRPKINETSCASSPKRRETSGARVDGHVYFLASRQSTFPRRTRRTPFISSHSRASRNVLKGLDACREAPFRRAVGFSP